MKFKDFFNEDYTVNWDRIEKLYYFERLKTTPQSSTWHQEGDAYKHTQNVVSELSVILNENGIQCGSDEWIMCMVAAICHDLGKADTTKWSDEKKDWTTKNHGVVGERITRNLFFDEEIIMREKVCYMVRHHMTLHHVFDNDEKVFIKLAKLSHGIVPIKYLLYLKKADSLGSKNDIETSEFIEIKYNQVLSLCAVLDCYDKPYSLIDKSDLIRDFIGYEGTPNKNNDFCVYILCGFPGCGKTTYINEYLKDKKVISRDIIRCELGIGGATKENDKKVVGTKEEEDKVSEIFDERMLECCYNKESFVLDNTNLKYQYRKEYLKKIMKFNPLVKIIYIEAPHYIFTCKQRRAGQIPNFVFDRMDDNFDFPQLYECNELVIYKEQIDGDDQIIKFSSDFSPKNVKLEQKILNDLRKTKGAMILDGYDCYDSCIKYMDELIKKYEKE